MPDSPKPAKDAAMERFRAKYTVTDSGCWQWNKPSPSQGYGSFSTGGRSHFAHRFGYEMYRGPIPDGLQIDHLCRNRGCVNPDHLEVVTARTNILRGVGAPAMNARKTHCLKGHEYSAANTHVTPKGRRRCKLCAAHRYRERWFTKDLVRVVCAACGTSTKKTKASIEQTKRMGRAITCSRSCACTLGNRSRYACRAAEANNAQQG